MFTRGLDLLADRLASAAGVSVTYTRGASSQSATGWVGRTIFSQTPLNGGGVGVVYGDRDYLIPVSSLTLVSPATPKEGDRITEIVGGSTLTFEVKPPNAAEPAWRYSDPGRTVYRIHCKRVV